MISFILMKKVKLKCTNISFSVFKEKIMMKIILKSKITSSYIRLLSFLNSISSNSFIPNSMKNGKELNKNTPDISVTEGIVTLKHQN